jgi:hypothetical protein
MKVTKTHSQPVAPKSASELSTSEQDTILKLVGKEKAAKKPGKGPIVARYMIVPGPIVARYLVIPPWGTIEAHQSVINKVSKDGKISAADATLIAKLFNRDIKEGDKVDRNIRPDVAKFLHAALDEKWMSAKAKDILFGQGGPGYIPEKPVPCYIMPPHRPGNPIYILPPKK